MRLLIDANILLDVLQERKPHAKDSSLVWKMCETGMAEGYILSLSFANLVYIMRKEMDAKEVASTLHHLSLIFSFADLHGSDLEKAACLCWEDFEDALQSVTAERLKADYIVTRNTSDYKNSSVPAITPAKLIALI